MVEGGEYGRTGLFGESFLSWLTVEKAAYGGAVLVALLLRLLMLGATPLGPLEAAQALRAFAASTGHEFDLVGVSPLLFGLQRLVFSLFGASDVWARWWPAVLGGLAPLFYFALRGVLGRGGALVAAYLWAISPMAVFATRLGVGGGLVPTLALAIVSGVALSMGTDPPRKGPPGLILAGGALGLLVASGPGAFTAILMALPAALLWRHSLARFWDALKASWKQVAGALLLCFALGATFFLVVPEGLAAAADLLGSWVGSLRPWGGEYSPWEIGLRLVLSEPVLVLFGLAGFAAACRQRNRFGIFAGICGALALLLTLLGGGRQPEDLGLIVLALTFLAGPVIAEVLRSAWVCRREADAWLLVAASTILLLSAALCLAGVFNPSNNASWRELYATVGVVTAALAGFLWLAYGVWGNWRTVAVASPLVLLVFGLIWGLGQLNGINYDHGAWRQAGVQHEVPARGWIDLQREVLDLASLNGAGRGEGAIDLVLPSTQKDSLDPTLRWELRSFPNLRVATSLSPIAAPIVITLPDEQPKLGSRYSGTEVTVLQRWDPSALTDFYSRLRWVLYREARLPGKGGNVVLWVKRSDQPVGTGTGGAQSDGVPDMTGTIE